MVIAGYYFFYQAHFHLCLSWDIIHHLEKGRFESIIFPNARE